MMYNKWSIFKVYNLVNFDIGIHQETITIIKAANIAITPKSVLVPLVFPVFLPRINHNPCPHLAYVLVFINYDTAHV